MPPMTVQSASEWWALIWYGGIAGVMALGVLMFAIGRIIPRPHHDWAITVLTQQSAEWRQHAEALRVAVERLAEELERRGRR